MFLYILIQMRKFVCLLILVSSFLFAETLPVADAMEGTRVEMEGEDSSRSVGLFERYSDGLKIAKHMTSIGMNISIWERHHEDYNLNADYGRWLAKGLYLSSELFSFHMLSDVGDSCTNSRGCARIGAGIALNGVLTMAAFVDSWIFDSDKITYFWFGLATLLNPTFEFFVVRKYIPVSIGLGYNTDWFAFSPGHKFYLRAHGDLNLNILFVRIAASYSYSFLDTYDLKKGSKKFYVKLILGPIF